MDIEVSIIIVNFNTYQMTKECIDSICQMTQGVEYEIILVDNNSSDGSREYFEKDKRIRLVNANGNIGFGRANNLGFFYSKGDFIFILNSGTILYNNAILQLFNYLKENPNVGCVGSVLKDKNYNVTHSYSTLPIWYKELIGQSTVCADNKNTFPAEVEMITGADIMIRRSVIYTFGLFDPDFFMYYEDTEMMWRYHRSGVKSIIINGPGIIHFGGSSLKNSYKRALMQTEGYYIYLDKTMKWGNRGAKLLLSLKRSITVWKKNWTVKEKSDYILRLFSMAFTNRKVII